MVPEASGESEMPPLFLMWVSGDCRGDTEMGIVGRTRFGEKMKAEPLNISRGRRLWATQRTEATGDPRGEGPVSGTPCLAQHHASSMRTYGTSEILDTDGS